MAPFTRLASIAFLSSFLIPSAVSVPTWPASSDELEDLMFLNNGFNAREFAFAVTPCSFARTPGRLAAAGFVRTAFHDMAPADVALGTGGVDASIGFELTGEHGEANGGPAFNNTMTYYSRFFSSKSSMADLVALGVYTAVRSCGGPVVPVRTGRIDATQAGPLGVPDVRDDRDTTRAIFQRLNLTQPESIQIIACGHTLGGVHSTEFPSIVPPNSTSLGVANFDSTNSTYDNRVVVEYLSGTTRNPLVVGPDVAARSDLRLFQSDQNVTMRALEDPAVFQSTCAKVLQKMIDTVPSSVKLTDAIVPYDVKPSELQLHLNTAGDKLVFSGQIRVRLADFSKADIESVHLVWKDRSGVAAESKIEATALGDASSFDDSFVFYGFEEEIPAKTAISLFNVVVTTKSGSTTYDNNGKGFPVEDRIFAQTLNSALASPDASGKQKLKIVAAVRNGQSASDVKLTVSTVNPMSFNNLPTLTKNAVAMVKICESQYYTFYSGDFDLTTAQVNQTKYDVSFEANGKLVADSFNKAELPVTAAQPTCGGSDNHSTTSSSSATSSSSYTTSWTTTTVTAITTFCPGPTTITHGDQTYTVTEATTLTITDCPCTISIPAEPTHQGTTTSTEALPHFTDSSIRIDGAQPTDPANGGSTIVVSVGASSSTPVEPAVATFTGGAARPDTNYAVGMGALGFGLILLL